MGKGEIACLYKQFLVFPQCFQMASFPDPSKGVIVWERVLTLDQMTYLDWFKLGTVAGNKVTVALMMEFMS